MKYKCYSCGYEYYNILVSDIRYFVFYNANYYCNKCYERLIEIKKNAIKGDTE